MQSRTVYTPAIIGLSVLAVSLWGFFLFQVYSAPADPPWMSDPIYVPEPSYFPLPWEREA